MKITVTDHERHMIITALRDCNTLISVSLANKILMQDPADDGPEIPILHNSHLPEGEAGEIYGSVYLPESWDD